MRMQRPAGNKGKTPFICLTGDILRVMQDRLNKNFSQGDPNSTSIETMKSSVGRVIERRVYLLELAGGLDASMEIPNAGEITIKDLLSKVIPIHIPIKITKIKVCQIMTDIWPVLQVVVANVSICKDASHDLQCYLDLMMRIEAAARRAISEAVVFLRSYQDKKQYFDLQSTLSKGAKSAAVASVHDLLDNAA